MHLDSSIVGLALRPVEAHATWRHITNFAAAVGDLNPAYVDDTRDDGLVAPPTFPVALSWPLLAALPDHAELPFGPEILLSLVHYSETIVLHRLIRPEDHLRLQGEIAALLPHRAGSHLVLKLAAFDERSRPVYTEYVGALLLGIPCSDHGAGAGSLPEVPKPPTEGTPRWEVPLPIAPEAAWVYDGCTGIENPLHTSVAFARQAGLPGTILHGTATLAYAVREVVNRDLDGDPHRVALVSARFTDPVTPGSTLQLLALAGGEGAATHGLHFRVLGPNGKPALSRGFLRAR
jgi:acyl dehydratase